MRQLADIVGASRSTISRAFQKDSSIRPELRARIVATARKHGYNPDPLVSELMTSFAKRRPVNYRETLGVLWWPDRWSQAQIAGSFAERLRVGMDASAPRHGCKVTHFVLGKASDAALNRTLKSRGIQGIVITPPTAPSVAAPVLDWTRLSVMVIGRSLLEPAFNRVYQNHYAACVDVLRRIRALGLRRPLLLADISLEERMQRAYTAAFLAHEAGPPEHVLHLRTHAPEELAGRLAGLSPDVIIGDTEQWLAPLNRLPASLRPPRFVCLDVSRQDGPVTGVYQNATRMAEAAIDLLMQARLRHETGLPAEPMTVLTPGSWVEGATLAGFGAANRAS